MKFMKILSLAIGLLCCSAPQAELIAIEEAIEAHDIKVTIYGTGNGYVLARSCANCPFTRLDLDTKTIVTVNGEPVGVTRRIEKHWSGGIVIYDIRTRRVVSLRL
jgi:hypothetical protein